MKTKVAVLVVSLCGVTVSTCPAQIVFTDDFDAGTSGSSWTAVFSGSDAVANFAYDYSSIGIPSAPNSTGGSTIGMNFVVNQSAGVQQGVSATPNGQGFIGDFRIQFDMWLNYVGPLPAGGSGSTQVGSFGWGTDGTAAQWAGYTDGVMFGATGDGGSSYDYRIYTNGALSFDTTAYTAGSLNASASYYTGLFGGEAAPAAQVALYTNQTGVTGAGVQGFAWRDVVVDKTGNIISWFIDGNSIGTIDVSGVALSGTNIFFGSFDINNSSSTDPNDFLTTAIFDNIVVAVPEPATFSLALLGGIGSWLFARRRKR